MRRPSQWAAPGDVAPVRSKFTLGSEATSGDPPQWRGEKFLELRRGHRLGKSVALQEVAADFPEQIGLLHGLDAFGDHPDIECTSDLDDRRDELALFMALCDRADQLTINLEPSRT